MTGKRPLDFRPHRSYCRRLQSTLTLYLGGERVYFKDLAIKTRRDVGQRRGRPRRVRRLRGLWWSDRDNGTQTLWPNTVRLSEAWRDSIKEAAVPLDTRALAIIQRAKAGPLAIDLYYWLAHRLYTVRKPALVPWALLACQFGSQYAVLRQFKAQVVKQLRVISLAYPQARVNVTGDGLLLSPSPPPVSRQTVIDL